MSHGQDGQGKYWVRWRDEFNHRHFKGRIETERAAQEIDRHLKETTRLARHALANAVRGALVTPADALEVYLAGLVAATPTKNRLRAKLQAFTRRIGAENLHALTPRLLETYLATRAEELSPTSLAREAADLKRWFEWLAKPEQAYMPANPLAGYDTSEPPPPPRHILSYEEEKQVLGSLTPRLRLRVLLALDAGLARQEVVALRKNHVNFDEQTLTIWRQKTKVTRTIPMTQRLAAILTEVCQGLLPDTRLQQWGGKEVKKGTDFLKKLWPRVGFHFRYHDLRHTFATRVAAATTNPFAVSALLGHSLKHPVYWRGERIPGVTRRYVQPTIEELRAAINAMQQANTNTKKEEKRE